MIRFFAILLLALLMAACGTQPPRPVEHRREPSTGAVPPSVATRAGSCPAPSGCAGAPSAPTFKPDVKKPLPALRGGGYYQDDGPGDSAPPDLHLIPDATPRAEPLHRFANNPYSVLGRDYVPLRDATDYRAAGIGSWYGRKFHGLKTSSGEPYDMYGMTAAHPTLPIPSYVRVTNPANSKSVIVRVNDRGPFHAGRLIDLSYTAAWKLDYIAEGSTRVIVEGLTPGQNVLAAKPAETAKPPVDEIALFATAAPLLTLPGEGGHYVQLGAFGNRDNAEALKLHLARELGELASKLVIRSAGSLHRVQLGPWPDAAAARLAAQNLHDTFELSPVVVQR